MFQIRAERPICRDQLQLLIQASDGSKNKLDRGLLRRKCLINLLRYTYQWCGEMQRAPFSTVQELR